MTPEAPPPEPRRESPPERRRELAPEPRREPPPEPRREPAPETLPPEPASATCVSCGAARSGEYCAACGEKRVDARDMTLRAFAAYAVEALTNADATLYATLRTLVRRPGVLTREFIAGRRKPYVGPLQTFLACNVVFFLLLQVGMGPDTFTTDLIFHRQQPLYGDAADALLTQRLGELPERHTGRTFNTWVAHATPEQAEYRQRFNEASPRYANSMVIIMVLLFALGIRLLRRRSLFVRDLVFSLHFHALLLLLVIAMALVVNLVVRLHPPLTPHLNSETTFLLVISTVCVTYLSLAFRAAYSDSRLAAVARGVMGFVLLAVVLTAYRAILFFVVFWATA